MRIKLKTLLAGPTRVVQPDTVIELPDAEAALIAALIAGGYAEEVKDEAAPAPTSSEKPEVETATREAAETATTRTGRAGGRRGKGAEG